MPTENGKVNVDMFYMLNVSFLILIFIKKGGEHSKPLDNHNYEELNSD